MTDSPAFEPGLTAELFRLASADNFRDVAGPGTGYATTDGRRVRRGVFYRSNELQLTDVDATQLAGLGIAVIHDLRSQQEVDAHPDVAVAGAEWRHREISGIPLDVATTLTDVASGHAMMHAVYDGFVRTPASRDSFAALLTDLATGPEPQLFHCTAGKDRTGWSAVLLLELAGVDRATVVADYLLTNDLSSATTAKYLALVAEHLGEDAVAAYRPTMRVEASYLQVAYDAVEEVYGSVGGYLSDGLGLSDDLLEGLRTRLLG